MKKTLIAAAALVAMTACNKTLIETPMTDSEYGYINLGITADTEMVVTKTGESTEDYLVALYEVDTKNTETTDDDESNKIVDFVKLSQFTNKQPKGTYYMEAQNVLPGVAHPATDDKGQIYRLGKSEYFTLEAGKSSDVTIETKIQNTGITVDYTEGFKKVFPSAEVKVTGLNGRFYTFAGDEIGHDKNKIAYFAVSSEGSTNLSIDVKLNNDKTVNLSRSAGKATWNKITFGIGDDGLINVTITVNDNLEEQAIDEVKIDPITGKVVVENPGA